MIAAGTNILVRFLVQDDAAAAERAAEILMSGEIFLSDSVVLETEWVLRKVYEVSKMASFETLSELIELPNVRVRDHNALLRAFGFARSGLEFADALHLALADAASEFATFDKKFAQSAKSAGAVPPVTLA